MKQYKILRHPNKFLRRKCRRVKTVTDRRKKKIKRMFELMAEKGGIGLAAPQIGWNARVFVMNTTKDPEKNLVFVNPEIVAVGGELIEFPEGCLSLPDVVGMVDRRQKVKVKAYDINGEPFLAEDQSIAGRCMLHEIDHLDGILMIDRAKKIIEGESIL
ncbi:MAG: peptide deformylase [Candidatus Sifarchaeia archaeon]